MSIVTLVSGGLDSTLMAVLAKESSVPQFPLFLNYGQTFRKREYDACISSFKKLHLPHPRTMNISGFGRLIPSGLTNTHKHVVRDAFLPNRNLLFIVCAGAYAHATGANAIGIGLLSEETHLFPDQTKAFLSSSEAMLTVALGRHITVVAPLMSFNKAQVVAVANERGITEWYSCHLGKKRPCGRCISCREYKFSK